jgi:7-cyano-7-deazaguanine synthase in queuosine biosynthesis
VPRFSNSATNPDMATVQYKIKCAGRNPDNFTIRETTGDKAGNFSGSMSASWQKEHTALTNGLARDLLRVGKGLFLCDRAFRRSKSLGGKTRQLDIVIPVENKKLWDRSKLKLETLARFVSHDNWTINFIDFVDGIKREASPFQNDFDSQVISLFSDGMDSLCGAAYAMSLNEQAVFVSHSPPGFSTAKKKLDRLSVLLSKTGLKRQQVNFRFDVNERDLLTGNRNRFPETRRRTRPLLYLSMAGAVAIELDIKTIRLNENGFLAINLPVRADRLGVANSRHAHPETLKMFEDLLNSLLPKKNLRVENPFLWETKGEETKHLKGAALLAVETVSCEFGRRQVGRIKRTLKLKGSFKECGLCIPCLVRRIALTSAGIKEPADHYAYSLKVAVKAIDKGKNFPGWPLFDQLKNNLVDFMDFAKKLEGMTRQQFVASYIYELSLLTREMEELPVIAENVYSLYRRFAKELVVTLDENR